MSRRPVQACLQLALQISRYFPLGFQTLSQNLGSRLQMWIRIRFEALIGRA